MSLRSFSFFLPARLGQRHPDRQLGDVRQELVQRRIARADPDRGRQPVHRGEDLQEVPPLQGKQGLQRLLALLVVLGEDQPLHILRAGRPGTCARCGSTRSPGPGHRHGRSASSTVSALARTRSRRTSSAPNMMRCTARTRSSTSSAFRAQGALEVLDDRRRHHRHLAGVHCPLDPSTEITSPSSTTVPSGAVNICGAWCRRRAPRPRTEVLPRCRGDDCGVAGLAAPAGQDALRGDHPVGVPSGLVSRQTGVA